MQTVLYDITQYSFALTAAPVLVDSRPAAFKHGAPLVREWVGPLSWTNQRRPSSLRVPVLRKKTLLRGRNYGQRNQNIPSAVQTEYQKKKGANVY